MKIKINKHGCLVIKRKSIWDEMYCQYDIDRFCGDRCVKFQEPKFYTEHVYGEAEGHIDLCNGDCIKFTELEDERE
jgi:hypothetical protein